MTEYCVWERNNRSQSCAKANSLLPLTHSLTYERTKFNINLDECYIYQCVWKHGTYIYIYRNNYNWTNRFQIAYLFCFERNNALWLFCSWNNIKEIWRGIKQKNKSREKIWHKFVCMSTFDLFVVLDIIESLGNHKPHKLLEFAM